VESCRPLHSAATSSPPCCSATTHELFLANRLSFPLSSQPHARELNLGDVTPSEIAIQPFPSYRKRQKTTSLLLAEVAGFKEIKFVSSLACNIRMKNAFLIPDPLIHNPLICNPQSPQGKKRKSTAALQCVSKISRPGPAARAHIAEPASL